MPEVERMIQLIIVTGMSGSGKSVALNTLEDDGYHCIDNLPSDLLTDVIDRLVATDTRIYDKLAIGIDMRSERFNADSLLNLLNTLRARDDMHTRIPIKHR